MIQFVKDQFAATEGKYNRITEVLVNTYPSVLHYGTFCHNLRFPLNQVGK